MFCALLLPGLSVMLLFSQPPASSMWYTQEDSHLPPLVWEAKCYQLNPSPFQVDLTLINQLNIEFDKFFKSCVRYNVMETENHEAWECGVSI